MGNTEVNKKDSTGFFSELSGFMSLVITLSAVLFPMIPNIDLIYLIKNLSVDGLLVYQLLFAVFAVMSSFGLLYIISRLAKSDKACGPIKKYWYYGMSVLFIFLFSFFMKEFYAPTNSFTSYFIDKELKVSYALVQDEAGIEYQIEYCSKSGQQIRCNINLYNKTSEDIDIKNLENIFLYDQLNQPAKHEKTVFNSHKANWNSHIHLTSKSKSNIDVYFNANKQAEIKLPKELTFKFSYSGKKRKVTFRNIPVNKAS